MTRFKFFTYLMPLAIAGGLALGLMPTPALATHDCTNPRWESHKHCEGEFFSTFFDVTLTGPVTGATASFHGSASENKVINLPTFNPEDMALNLTFFAEMDMGNDALCFPDAGSTRLFAALIQSKNVKGGGALQAIGMFWFDADTKSDPDDEIEVSYVLQMFGTFEDPDTWPNTNTVTMTDWNMKVETTTKGGRKIACTSDGPFPAPVLIDVVEQQPQ